MIKISPSLLSADMARLADEVEKIKKVADYAHCDVMDGHFVDNLTIGLPVINSLKKLNIIPLDVHLMIEFPGKWIDRYLDTGLKSEDYLVFHFEPEPNPGKTLEEIKKKNVKSGISIKPGTPFSKIAPYLDLIDQILIMTVEPGRGAQKLIKDVLPKITEARLARRENQVVAVDGGIKMDTIKNAVRAGAELIIAGSAVFGKEDPVMAIKELRKAAEEVRFEPELFKKREKAR